MSQEITAARTWRARPVARPALDIEKTSKT